jgi:drug/metabolite transporter (DMT)-like permease
LALAWAGIGLLGLIWGGSFLSNVVLLREMGVLTTVAARVTLAAIALWAYVVAAGLSVPRGLRAWRDFAVMGLLNVAFPFTMIVWAQVHVPSGLASILNASTAIFGVLVAALVFADERLTGQKAAGVALGFTGVATVIGLEAVTRFDPTSLAQIALIASSLSYGFGGAWARARLTGYRPQVAAAAMLTMAALMMVPYAALVEGVPTMAYAVQTWAALAYLSLIATAGNIVAQGGSAGGMLMGAVNNMRPDLWAGIIGQVPFVDVINTMSDTSLPLTPPEWPEWGNPLEDPEAYDYMMSYSPYDQVGPRA